MQEMLVPLVQAAGEAPDWMRYTFVLFGVALVTTGWRGYRFWFGAAITLLAGVWGIVYSQRYGLSPVLAGLLTAVSIGCVALALTRLVVFVAGGWLCWQVVYLALGEWANPLVCFCLGGILSSLIFGLVVRLVTSGLGVLLIALGLRWVSDAGQIQVMSGLWEKLGVTNPSWIWLGATLVAALLQAFLDKGIDWWQARRQEAKKKAAEKKETAAQAA